MSKDKYKIALLGGRGYVGQEIIKLLNSHPLFDLSMAFSKSLAEKNVDGYIKNPNLKYTNLSLESLSLPDIDIVICALANGESSVYIDKIEDIDDTIIIIDIGSDYRFDDGWSYGIPEIHNISKGTKRISNPGCYATAMQLAIAPLKDHINSKVSCVGISGYSGAGSTPNDKNDPKILKNNILPYSLSNHTHEKEVKRHCYEKTTFTPHVAEFFRGILVTSHFSLDQKSSELEVYEIFKKFYEDKKLIIIDKSPPLISNVVNTNFAKIGGFSLGDDGKSLVVCSVIDNLLKGAASQCIQNLNDTFGIEDSLYLEDTHI